MVFYLSFYVSFLPKQKIIPRTRERSSKSRIVKNFKLGFKNTLPLGMNSLEPINPNKIFIFAQILKNIYRNPTLESALL